MFKELENIIKCLLVGGDLWEESSLSGHYYELGAMVDKSVNIE